MRHCRHQWESQPDSGTGKSPLVAQVWLTFWLADLELNLEKHEGLLPASCYFLVESLCSDAHIVVSRNKHGKNGCSLTTYYTQPVFLSLSFCFLRIVSNEMRNVLVMLNRAHNAHYLTKECSAALWVSSLHLGEDGRGESNKRTTAIESLLTSTPSHCHF